MMTADSLGAASAKTYAEYLDAQTKPPERGDYYLGREGRPAEAPGIWRAPPDVLEALGIDPCAPVSTADFVALMEGRVPEGARVAIDAAAEMVGDEEAGADPGGATGNVAGTGAAAAISSTVGVLGNGLSPTPADGAPAALPGMRAVVPAGAEYLRPASKDGTRAAGVDVTFSAPKSVSIVWALAPPEQRAVIETAHSDAVAAALKYLRKTVPLTKKWDTARRADAPALARDLLAAEFRHTTARGVGGGPPDPQLHSHVVITSIVNDAGRVRAVRSRPVFRAAREIGAYYRAALAEHLQAAGYEIEAGTGKDGRYFEIAGISKAARDAFSRRTVEVKRAIAAFRARFGRDPERGELRTTKLLSREAKAPETVEALVRTWVATAAEERVGLTPAYVAALSGRGSVVVEQCAAADSWRTRVEKALTAQKALFGDRDLRMAALERAPGLLGPDVALGEVAGLHERRDVLRVVDGRLTTQALRRLERECQRVLVDAAAARAERAITGAVRAAAIATTEERIGAALSIEQRAAVEQITGTERAAMLIGEAGTGKGVVIDAAARAELAAGRRVIGTAVSGSTAERLGRDSPALADGSSIHVDALLAQVQHGHRDVDERTTIFFDEAGMADTDRLAWMTRLAKRTGAKLVLIGDAAQLPAIGAGGMFEVLQAALPTAVVSEVRRTRDRAEQAAWRALRDGDSGRAMAHYAARGQLHLSDVREDALDNAVRRYDALARQLGYAEVALMTDGTNMEIDAMNARAQQLRLQRGELSEAAVPLPLDDGPVYQLRAGDRVAWRRPQRVPGERRVENGTRGTIAAVDPSTGTIRVQVDGTGRVVDVGGEPLAAMRLAYAQHLYRQQGATVDRAVTLTGGWQTSREGSYVQASRARHGIDWHVARADLGTEGTDADRIVRLAEAMRPSSGQRASITRPLQTGFDLAIDGLAPPTDVETVRSALAPTRPATPGPAPVEVER